MEVLYLPANSRTLSRRYAGLGKLGSGLALVDSAGGCKPTRWPAICDSKTKLKQEFVGLGRPTIWQETRQRNLCSDSQFSLFLMNSIFEKFFHSDC
jgi:hypothetical protein